MKLRIDNFKKEYKNKIVEIDNIILNKRVSLIVGENGCGKSTLLKAIAGLIKYQGEISLFPDSCYLSENPSYPYSITVNLFLKSLASIDKSSDTIIDFFLDLFSLKEKRESPINNLSKGMLQKLNLIQCLMQDKELYLLDEPYSGLDKKTVMLLNDYIKNSKKKFIISSHLKNFSDFEDLEVISIV